MSKLPKPSGVNATGRNKHPRPFIKLDLYMVRSAAYRSLKALPRSVYTALRERFNGRNNGQIRCSVRDLAKDLHCSKDSAGAALKELEAKGFIRCAQPGSFNYKVRHAAIWILTEESLGNQLATKDFMRWEPKEKNAGPKSRTLCPKIGTDGSEYAALKTKHVPE